MVSAVCPRKCILWFTFNQKYGWFSFESLLIFHVSLRRTTSIFVSDKVYCDSYDCPDNYKLLDDADDIMCKDKKCTKDQCCKKGEEHPKHTLREVDDDAKCPKLE